MNVFISYAHSDETLARKLAEALRAKGIDAWDDRHILPGDNWASVVSEALQKSDAMVVLLRPEGLRFGNQQFDIDYALGKSAYRGRLIPALVEPESAFSEVPIPWFLRTLKMVQLHEPAHEQEGIEQITEALRMAA
jgi:hypothetical protein